MPRGGKRPGAGRPKKNRTQQGLFEDAESYLTAVVKGLTPPDSARITAAKTLLAYQIPKKRPKAESPPPKKMRSKAAAEIEKDNILEFERKAAKIRAKYAKIKELE